MRKEIVVLGLGNEVMGDEGIGVRILKRFEERSESYPEVDFLDAGTGGMSVVHMIAERKKAIFIDCAKMGSAAGTIKRFTPADVKSVKELSGLSLHETDLLKVISLSETLGTCPGEIVIFGIEPEKIEPGGKISKSLSGNIEGYIALISKDLG